MLYVFFPNLTSHPSMPLGKYPVAPKEPLCVYMDGECDPQFPKLAPHKRMEINRVWRTPEQTECSALLCSSPLRYSGREDVGCASMKDKLSSG